MKLEDFRVSTLPGRPSDWSDAQDDRLCDQDYTVPNPLCGTNRRKLAKTIQGETEAERLRDLQRLLADKGAAFRGKPYELPPPPIDPEEDDDLWFDRTPPTGLLGTCGSRPRDPAYTRISTAITDLRLRLGRAVQAVTRERIAARIKVLEVELMTLKGGVKA